jgi:hypothetical protein
VNAQQLRGQLIGNWIATSCESKVPIVNVICPNIVGRTTFSPSGLYTTIILGKERPKIGNGANGVVDRSAISTEQYKGMGQSTTASFGTWSVDEASKTLIQHVEGNFFGGTEGTDTKLSVNLTGDDLKITNVAGTVVSWKREVLKTLQSHLIPGTWSLVSCDNISRPICANPDGKLDFDSNGYSMILIAKGRAKIASLGPASNGSNNPYSTVTPEDYKAAAQGVVVNYGTWSIDESTKTATLKVEKALFPNFEGT